MKNVIVNLDNFFTDETFFDSVNAFMAAKTVSTRQHYCI